MPPPEYRRILYRSRATGRDGGVDLPSILSASRLNNGLDGVSGLLWTDGRRYVQFLEGPPESVAMTFARIGRDPRHDRVEVIDDSAASERVFGDWSMANLPDGSDADDRARLARALSNAPAVIRQAFVEATG